MIVGNVRKLEYSTIIIITIKNKDILKYIQSENSVFVMSISSKQHIDTNLVAYSCQGYIS